MRSLCPLHSLRGCLLPPLHELPLTSSLGPLGTRTWLPTRRASPGAHLELSPPLSVRMPALTASPRSSLYRLLPRLELVCGRCFHPTLLGRTRPQRQVSVVRLRAWASWGDVQRSFGRGTCLLDLTQACNRLPLANDAACLLGGLSSRGADGSILTSSQPWPLLRPMPQPMPQRAQSASPA